MTRSYTCPPTSARHVIAKSVDITVISRFANSVIDAHVRAAKLSASKLAHATRTPTEDLVSWRTRELTMSSARLPATAAGHARTNSACRPAVAAPFTTGHVSGEDEGSRRRSLLRPSPRAMCHARTEPTVSPSLPRPSPPATCHARTKQAVARRCCALHRGPRVTRGRSPLPARRCCALHRGPRATRRRRSFPAGRCGALHDRTGVKTTKPTARSSLRRSRLHITSHGTDPASCRPPAVRSAHARTHETGTH